MLRISKYKERIYLNNDPIVHYPFDLKIGNKKFNLNEKWSEIQVPNVKRLEIGNRVISQKISKNFYQYIRLSKLFQERCLYFSKFLINSNIYQMQKKFRIMN